MALSFEKNGRESWPILQDCTFGACLVTLLFPSQASLECKVVVLRFFANKLFPTGQT